MLGTVVDIHNLKKNLKQNIKVDIIVIFPDRKIEINKGNACLHAEL